MYPNSVSTQLNLFDIIKLLWQEKLLIICIVFVAACLSFWYALSANEVYMAELKAAPSESSLMATDSSLQATIALRLKGYGSASGEYEKHLVAVQILRSQNFIANFIEKHNLKPFLYAVTGWNKETESLVWDSTKYNPETKNWLIEPVPTLQEATQQFILKNLVVIDDRKERVLTLQILHTSPFLAAEWASLLMNDLNEHMRAQEFVELEKKRTFYTQQLPKSLNHNTKKLISTQIENITYKQLLNNSNAAFLFDVFEQPLVPERRAYPNRALIVILGTFLGGLLALVVAFTKLLLFPPAYLVQNKKHA